MEEFIGLSEESEKRTEDIHEVKREALAWKAMEMRDRAMERLGETRERNQEEREEESNKKETIRRRHTGVDKREGSVRCTQKNNAR